MNTKHGPVHPVLRAARSPHPWARRRHVVRAAKAAVAGLDPLSTVPSITTLSPSLSRGAGGEDSQSFAAGTPGTAIPSICSVTLTDRPVANDVVEERAS